MEFEKITTTEFNERYGTRLDANMTFDEGMKYIEGMYLDYFYASLDASDILQTIEDVGWSTDMVELIHITDIGIHIAIY